MADKKSVGHAYNIDFLNVVFAASSLFLFFSSLWMVWDDYDREWKGYQRQFVLLETEVTQAGLAAAQGQVDQAELTRLQTERAAAEEAMAGSQAQIDELQGQLDEIEAELYRVSQAWQFTKANYDVERYAFEERQDHDPEHAAEERPAIDARYQEWLDLGLQVDALNVERDGIRAQISGFTSQVGEFDQQIRDLTTETTRLGDASRGPGPEHRDCRLERAAAGFHGADDYSEASRHARYRGRRQLHGAWPRWTAARPVTLRSIGRDTRSIRQPFTTHPNLEAYVGSASSHPVAQFGCTVCHEGMGQSVTFEYASHTPANMDQMAEWEEERHWEVPHLWDYPMLPTNMTEASCAKCHQETVFVPEGPEINLAYGVYERAGCYACHTTAGFQGLRKPGPNLTRIAAKLDEGMGGELDPRSASREAEHVDATGLVQLE